MKYSQVSLQARIRHMLGKATYASEVRCRALERFSCGDAFAAFRSNICRIEDQAIHQALLRHIHPHARPKLHARRRRATHEVGLLALVTVILAEPIHEPLHFGSGGIQRPGDVALHVGVRRFE